MEYEFELLPSLLFQELLKALIGFIDVAGLYFALTQLTHRNISQNHKFQAVGLGEWYLMIVIIETSCFLFELHISFWAFMYF